MARILETKNRVSVYVMYLLIPLAVIMALVSVLALFGFLPFPNNFINLVYGFIFTAMPTMIMLGLLQMKRICNNRNTKYLVLFIAIAEISVINILFTVFAFPLFFLPVILSLYYQSRKLTRHTGIASLVAVCLSCGLAYWLSSGTFTDQKDLSMFRIEFEHTVGIFVLEILIFVLLLVSALFVSNYLVRLSNYQNSMANTVAKDEQLGVFSKYQFEIEMKNKLINNSNTDFDILITDVQKFSVFNDLFGHEKGDLLLKSIAEALSRFGGPGSIVGRVSDDHMACLIQKDMLDEQKLTDVFFHNNTLSGSANYSVTVVCGIYEITDRRVAADIMIDRALMAVHSDRARVDGFAYYRDSMLYDLRRNNQFLAELNDALNENQFEPFLQPQFDAEGNMKGAEVLVRWMSPTRGMVPPDEFISACEEHGYISRLDKNMWIKACEVLSNWEKKGINDIYLSVNVSKVDLFELDILEVLKELVNKYGVNPSRLHLEITETSMMKEFTKFKEIISSLRQFGFVVEIDDFGSGYSSLGMLSEIEIDAIKVDSSFVNHLDRGIKSRSIVKIIAKMVSDLGTHSVVEGVETREQLDFLKKAGFEIFQGFYFSKAIRCDEFEKKYLSER